MMNLYLTPRFKMKFLYRWLDVEKGNDKGKKLKKSIQNRMSKLEKNMK